MQQVRQSFGDMGTKLSLSMSVLFFSMIFAVKCDII